jgi:tRNA(adenine34) deaminase
LSQDLETHERWMTLALQQAEAAAQAGEVPVGAVLIAEGEVLAQAHNRPISAQDPTAHAEILALRAAAIHQQNYRLPRTTLYVTIEPCTMCVGALVHARIDLLVFGAREPRSGAVVSQQNLLDSASLNHKVRYQEGVLAEECGKIMQAFFQSRR